ncbi:DUF6273 domain-containing protein [Oribacterium sp. FC2011]|uniref:DUF6273 domain-containing protein n=1 Tax=Oribacterium sp. FC2011 TaxID=1408311 RepID=UPI000679B9C3|nr:DUF6273 domain-containing protein [Oribacterium sp. FC2011]
MTVLKCKMCGGDLVVEPNTTVCECEYCGSKQTIPTVDNEKKITLFSRANRLLRSCEFDKAEGIFESIVAEFPEEAEAYWGLVLCKYGIEYVDDPATGKKVPTCHRSSFDSVMDDSDFEQVMENADTVARAVYREQAKQIEELRKGIIEVSGKEEPYDIFICYKETDENNERTIDSVLAQDIYDALTSKGYRVFFSRISLEDKLGVEYEPYIFAALNSAKVMLAVGTSYDYYNAVWVKNEWSRYLKLIAADKSKYLIPCYKDIDAYDIPKEFAKLQAQDLGKVGAIQDLIRGIDKLFGKDNKPENPLHSQIVQQVVTGGSNVAALLKRGYDSIEDGEFEEANKFFNDALNIEAESAEAYLGLFLTEIGSRNKEEARKVFIAEDCTDNRYWMRAKQYAKGNLAVELLEWEESKEKNLARIKEMQEKRIARFKEIQMQIQKVNTNEYEIEYSPEEKKILLDLKNKYEEAKSKAEKVRNELDEKQEQIKAHQTEIKDAINQKHKYMAEYESLKNEEIKEKQHRMEGLGFFKGKEKKILQEQIYVLEESLSNEKKKLQDQIGGLEVSLKKDEEDLRNIVREIDDYETACDVARSKGLSFQGEIKRKIKRELLKEAYLLIFGIEEVKTGSIVQFGRYENGNGVEPIKWRVLENTNSLFLLTEQAIDCRKYNEKNENVTWEKCTLREWLNKDFFNAAFNEEEQNYIKTSIVPSHKDSTFKADPGMETEDHVFLLSIAEVRQYLNNKMDRVCKPSQLAVNHGVFVGFEACAWWLRSQGKWNNETAAISNYRGEIKYVVVDRDSLGVRPALKIDLDVYCL